MHVTIRAMTLVLPLQRAERVASGAIDVRADSLFPGYIDSENADPFSPAVPIREGRDRQETPNITTTALRMFFKAATRSASGHYELFLKAVHEPGPKRIVEGYRQ